MKFEFLPHFRASLLSALLSLEKGEMAESSGVELFPVTAFRLEPLCKKGHITVDGEVIDYETVQAEILPSFVRICN